MNEGLILTLAGSMAAALVLGYATHRLGLSPIVGYLLAGVLVGPYTPGFVADRHLAEQMAEVGVILLMFGVGLHFHLEELLSVWQTALPGALGQSAAATVLGALVGAAWGWGWGAGLVFGLALSVASTVVLTRVLSDNNDLHTPAGHVVVGWLVVEDLLTVLVLVLLPLIFSGQGAAGVAWALALAGAKMAAFVALVFTLGGRLITWVFGVAAEARCRELFTLTVLVVALGVAVGSAKLFGVSMALGAFLAGMVAGRSEFSLRAAAEAIPMRDAFAVLFFVSVGMLFDPRFLITSPGLAAATLAVILLGKPAAAFGIVLLMGKPVKTALSAAAALAQIGEFSFILSAVGQKLGVLPDEAGNALVAAAIVSISLNPPLYRLVGPLASMLGHRGKLPVAPPPPDSAPSPHRAVVVGYGPVGRTLTRLLRENQIEPVVVEMNLETVRRLRAEGAEAVYGDAGSPATLAATGIGQASSLFLTSSGLAHGEIIRLARELSPRIRVFVRCSYLRERAELCAAGADAAFAGEGEVALAMAESLLRRLGAGPDQIDRERGKLRADLFGDAT
jgi:CPA2 family monovalent cation:H+ antiporter-2